MGGKSSTISTAEPRLGNLRVQTSMQGVALPWVRGQTRIVGNLLWFGNFQAIAITTSTSQGGKGGGGVTQVDTRYEYKAAAILALCSGPVVGIVSAWKGKNRIFGDVIGARQEIFTDKVSAFGTVQVPLYGGTFVGTQGLSLDMPSDYDSGD